MEEYTYIPLDINTETNTDTDTDTETDIDIDKVVELFSTFIRDMLPDACDSW